MNETNKQRIAQVRSGEIPKGYITKHGYCFPTRWSIRKLRNKFTRLSRKNSINCKNVLTISAQQGLISQQEYYNYSYASENTQGYSLLKRGDYAYNKSYSDGYFLGAIKRLDKYDQGVVSPLYICFSPNADTNSDYYSQYFEAGVFNREIYSIAQEGARNHGLLNVAVEEFFDGYILCPPNDEQQKIAEILAQCDRVIALKQKLLEEKRKQKKWLMQKLFMTPKSNWHTYKLRNCGKWFGGGTPDKNNAEYWSGDIKWVSSQEVKERQITGTTYMITKKAVQESASNMAPPYSLLVVTRSGILKRRLPVAFISEAMAINQDVKALVPNDGIYYYYLLSFLEYKEMDILSAFVKTGTTVQSLMFSEFLDMEVPIPRYSEQVAISDIFSTANREITLLEQELVAWKEKKKGLAQLLLTGLVRV